MQAPLPSPGRLQHEVEEAAASTNQFCSKVMYTRASKKSLLKLGPDRLHPHAQCRLPKVSRSDFRSCDLSRLCVTRSQIFVV